MSERMANIVLYGTGILIIVGIIVAYHIKVHIIFKDQYRQMEIDAAKEHEKFMRDIQNAREKYGDKLSKIEEQYYSQWPRSKGWKDKWHL